MKFDSYIPSEQLKPYIKQFVVSENEMENEYTVFPNTSLVIGFQYKGKLVNLNKNIETSLSSAGISGISDSFKIFKNSTNIGTILVYFNEIGFTHFTSHPAHELFNLSISLDTIFEPASVLELEEKLAECKIDLQRIHLVNQFFINQLKEKETDKLVVEAIKLIYQSKGTVKIKELNEKLFISQSPFEKRFRKVVGTTAKKFTSIVRFNSVLEKMNQSKTLNEICYENNFFDQAHFIKNFKQFTGKTPVNFKRNK